MIASGGPCYSDRLIRLLESQLSVAEERAVTEHLDHCAACREELNQLAGTVELWQETRTVLSDSQELSISPDHSRIASDTAQANFSNWIAGLLEPSDDAGSLGKLDGRSVLSVVGQGGMGVVLRSGMLNCTDRSQSNSCPRCWPQQEPLVSVSSVKLKQLQQSFIPTLFPSTQ